ncbi:MAG: hypothetical protein EOO02_16745 [Chitinophagaceae bacterium]|nr:MAG: hypothetical protein EOO02_16745 [Chitinophagaceae bacterium]
MVIIIIIIAVVIFIGIVLYFAANSSPKTNNINELEQARQFYEAALNGKDRKAVLAAGRLYYSLTNSKHVLTMHDEFMIGNDLSTMPVETYQSETI